MERYTIPTRGDAEATAAALWAAGAVGVWERDDDLVAWFAGRGAPVPAGGAWETEEDRDWTAAWKAGLEPVTVGDLTVTPSWIEDRPGPRTIVLDPGMAFGTGHHATTRLCLAALQEVDLTGTRVLDVGTGSGVLGIAAVRRGAAEVIGVDTDPEAIVVAEGNAARNEVSLDLREGSIEAAAADGPFDVVVANVITDAILELAPALLDATRRVLITSGISAARAGEVEARLRELGAGDVRATTEGEWAAVVVRREPDARP